MLHRNVVSCDECNGVFLGAISIELKQSLGTEMEALRD
jgi:hypothetical protein